MIYYYLDKIVTRLKMSHFSQQTPIKRCFMPFILSLEEKKIVIFLGHSEYLGPH